MRMFVTRDGWFFISNNLADLLEIIKGEFLFNIESVAALLEQKEQFVLLKAIVTPEEGDPIEEFYRTNLSFKRNVIANIINNRSIDLDVKRTETHIGGGIYKEGKNWNLFLPLEI